MANQLKQSQLTDVVDMLENNPNFALLKYEKTTHTTLEKLRRDLKKTDSKVKILKNSIFEKAINRLSLKHTHLKDLQKKYAQIKDSTALLLLGSDWSASLATFSQFTKTEKSLTFKAGCLDEKVYLTQDMEKISKLPGKDVLVGKIIGSMKSPIARFTLGLKFNQQKLVYILSQKAQQG